MPKTEAAKRAAARYDKARTRLVVMKLNLVTDADIFEWLGTQQNRQGYIKGLIRADMARQGFEPACEQCEEAREQDA